MKFRIGLKLIMGFSIVLIITTLLTVNALLKFNDVKKSQNDILKSQYPSFKTLMEAQSNIANCRRVLFQHILTKDNEKSLLYEEVLTKDMAKVNENMKVYEPTIVNENERKYYEEFKKSWEEYLGFSNRALEESKKNNDVMAQDIVNQGQQAYDNARTSLQKNVDLNNEFITQGEIKASGAIDTAKKQIIVFLIIALIVAIAFAAYITKGIVSSSKKILEIINSVSKGDLTKEVNIKTSDEIKMIGDSTNYLINSLKSIVERIINVANRVAYSSEKLSATTEETNANNIEIAETINSLAKSATNQFEAVYETENIMNSMSENIEKISEDICLVSESTHRVVKASASGLTQVNNAVDKINEIKEITNKTSSVINNLGKQSNTIGEIVEVIKSIASQTNLLALNAAIESARAGEMGRGFSIVAEEIRKLSEESSESAEEIAKLIENIQRETKIAMNVMEKGRDEVINGVACVNDTGEAFKAISSEVETVAKQIKEVEFISNDILEGSEKVSCSINNINNITKEYVNSFSEVTAATKEENAAIELIVNEAQELASLGIELQSVVSSFKV